LHARDGEIGRLKEVFFDDRDWTVRYFVVQTGAWLGKEVLVPPSTVLAVDDEGPGLQVDLTREQIGNCPDVKTSLPISRHSENDFYGYYGINPYWMDDPLAGDSADLQPAPAAAQPREADQPNLRSSQEVTGYHIHAEDGEIGHVEDFILDDQDWVIRYLEVNTRNWLPGKQVLIAPVWIHAIDWHEKEVVVNLDRAAIESAPDYDPSKVISNDDEVALYKHYGMTLKEE
jgi:uncharacterized protein YrrD